MPPRWQLANAVSRPDHRNVSGRWSGVFRTRFERLADANADSCFIRVVEYDLGTALRSNGDLVMTNLAGGMTPQTASAASVALRGKGRANGYLPEGGISLAAGQRAYPGECLQRHAGGGLPDLLRCGRDCGPEACCRRAWMPWWKRPTCSNRAISRCSAPDGQTLILAQVPRAIQGGLSFNFLSCAFGSAITSIFLNIRTSLYFSRSTPACANFPHQDGR